MNTGSKLDKDWYWFGKGGKECTFSGEFLGIYFVFHECTLHVDIYLIHRCTQMKRSKRLKQTKTKDKKRQKTSEWISPKRAPRPKFDLLHQPPSLRHCREHDKPPARTSAEINHQARPKRSQQHSPASPAFPIANWYPWQERKHAQPRRAAKGSGDNTKWKRGKKIPPARS